MNIALILAGGVGNRFGNPTPKQFLAVYKKPLIVYAMEAFQSHPEIDAISVVCLEGWEKKLLKYVENYKIKKFKWMFKGGATGQESIRNGVFGLEKVCKQSDIILIHDAVRPLVSHEIISECIYACRRFGSGIASIPCVEAILKKKEVFIGHEIVPRESLVRTQTPQAFRLSKLIWAYREALKRGITNSVAACTLMIELGGEVRLCHGSEINLKITTSEDLEIFKALLKHKRKLKKNK